MDAGRGQPMKWGLRIIGCYFLYASTRGLYWWLTGAMPGGGANLRSVLSDEQILQRLLFHDVLFLIIGALLLWWSFDMRLKKPQPWGGGQPKPTRRIPLLAIVLSLITPWRSSAASAGSTSWATRECWSIARSKPTAAGGPLHPLAAGRPASGATERARRGSLRNNAGVRQLFFATAGAPKKGRWRAFAAPVAASASPAPRHERNGSPTSWPQRDREPRWTRQGHTCKLNHAPSSRHCSSIRRWLHWPSCG